MKHGVTVKSNNTTIGEMGEFIGPADTRQVAAVEATRARTAAALAELAGIGSDVCALLHAVQGGATLVITGPDPIGRTGAPKFGASLESATGAREAHAMGDDLPRLLSDLVKCWGSAASMANRVPVSPAVSR